MPTLPEGITRPAGGRPRLRVVACFAVLLQLALWLVTLDTPRAVSSAPILDPPTSLAGGSGTTAETVVATGDVRDGIARLLQDPTLPIPARASLQRLHLRLPRSGTLGPAETAALLDVLPGLTPSQRRIAAGACATRR